MRRIRRGALVVALLSLSIALGPEAEAVPRRPDVPAQPVPVPTVKVHGKSGTFGDLGSITKTASGQSFATQPVTGWSFPSGREFWANARTADGSIIVAGGDQNACQPCQTASESAIGAFNPTSNTFTVTKLKTTIFDAGGNPTPGVEAPPTPGMVSDTVGDPAEQRGGTSVSDVATFNSGNAVAFVAWSDHLDHDVNQYGIWPAFGVLTKVNGVWQVANGSGWMNQWTGKELRTSRPDSTKDEAACPENINQSVSGYPPVPVRYAGHSDCGSLNEIEALPPSGIPNTYDFVVTQYGDDNGDATPAIRGGVSVLRVAGPDASGRYTAKVMDKFTYPLIPDRTTPSDPNDYLGISVMGVMAEPASSSTPTDQRFTVNFDMWQKAGNPAQPTVFQELSYNATTGTITPISAPLLPGDNDTCGSPFGFKHVVYGSDGTLYATRFGCNFTGGKLAVFPKVGGQRRLQSVAACAFSPATPLENYQTTVGSYAVWGKVCRPNYDIVQATALPFTIPAENPVTHDIVLTSIHGDLLPIRPSGSGTSMSFQVGNLVDVDHELLGHTTAGTSFLLSHGAFGSFDPDGRLWLSVGEARTEQPCEGVTYPRYLTDDPATPSVNEGKLCLVRDALPSNNWLVSVDVDDLFNPPAVALPTNVNDIVGLQAEASTTMSTVKQSAAAPAADFEFFSNNYVTRCTGSAPLDQYDCSHDLGVGDGYTTDDIGGFGHGSTPLTYQVSVAATGCYKMGYFVSTWGSQTGATITASAGASSVATNVHSSDGTFPTWSYKQSTTNLCFTTTGTHTLTLTGSGGLWYLNWFSLQRI